MGEVGISLGWNCYSAVRAVELGLRSRREHGYKTCPFDEALTNYRGVIECLRDDFKYFCDPAHLEVFEVPDNSLYCANDILIRNTKYNFVFNHESPRHANLWQTQRWPGGPNHYVANSYEKFIERYERRIENFRSYIRSGAIVTFILTRPYPVDTSELEEMLRDTYPSLKYKIVCLDLELGKQHYSSHLNLMGLSSSDPEILRMETNQK